MPVGMCDVVTIGSSDLMICPFSYSHQMKPSKFIKHVNRCRERHPNVEIYTCIYNASHIMRSHLKTHHLLTCPDRRPIARASNLPSDQTTSWRNTDDCEYWGDGYDAEQQVWPAPLLASATPKKLDGSGNSKKKRERRDEHRHYENVQSHPQSNQKTNSPPVLHSNSFRLHLNSGSFCQNNNEKQAYNPFRTGFCSTEYRDWEDSARNNSYASATVSKTQDFAHSSSHQWRGKDSRKSKAFASPSSGWNPAYSLSDDAGRHSLSHFNAYQPSTSSHSADFESTLSSGYGGLQPFVSSHSSTPIYFSEFDDVKEFAPRSSTANQPNPWLDQSNCCPSHSLSTDKESNGLSDSDDLDKPKNMPNVKQPPILQTLTAHEIFSKVVLIK